MCQNRAPTQSNLLTQVNQQIALKDLGTIVLSSCVARSIIFVPGTSGGVAQNNSDNPLRTDLVKSSNLNLESTSNTHIHSYSHRETRHTNSPTTTKLKKSNDHRHNLQVWIATDDRRILLYVAADPENGSEVGRIMLPAAPLCQVPPQDVHHRSQNVRHATHNVRVWN